MRRLTGPGQVLEMMPALQTREFEQRHESYCVTSRPAMHRRTRDVLKMALVLSQPEKLDDGRPEPHGRPGS